MALDPDETDPVPAVDGQENETDPVPAVDGQETDPEIGIEPLFKVLALPAEDPALIDRVDYILGVAVEDDFRIGVCAKPSESSL